MCLFFETIKVKNKKIYNLKYHNLRLNKTIKENFNINSDIDLADFIKLPNSNELFKCKVIYNKSIKKVEFSRYKKREFNSFMILKSDLEYKYKYLDRKKIDDLYKLKKSADDILIIDNNGKIKDTSIANVALKIDGIWFTPKDPLLAGTKRQSLLEKNILKSKELFVKDIEKIESFAIMNAMLGFLEIPKPNFFLS